MPRIPSPCGKDGVRAHPDLRCSRDRGHDGRHRAPHGDGWQEWREPDPIPLASPVRPNARVQLRARVWAETHDDIAAEARRLHGGNFSKEVRRRLAYAKLYMPKDWTP